MYDCKVYHSRSKPKKHAFSYRLFMFYIDLDEEQTLEKRFRLVGSRGWAPYQLRVSDHYDAEKPSIKENVIQFLEENGFARNQIGTIGLLTHLRTFGHIFNPVSFYFVKTPEGDPLCSIAEVDNTFNEQKLFLIKERRSDRFQDDQSKLFYVSPFSDLDTVFHFQLQVPNEKLKISINQSDTESRRPYFTSSLSGEQTELSDWKLIAYSLRFPAITLGIVWGIHWHAFLLFLKGLKVRRKASRPELQQDKHIYLKPHNHSIH
nr:DUF1365 domain-containing protein [Pelagicoccus albus]